MKKTVICLLSLICLLSCVVTFGCTKQFDDKEILKIQTSWVEGFAPYPRSFERTFDFKTGKVYDTLATDFDANMLAPEGTVCVNYNSPKLVTTFSEQQADEFISEIKTLGMYSWKERYVTDDVICDGGSSSVTVYFADGTEKNTYIYFKYPPKYDEIRKTFKEHLGTDMYMTDVEMAVSGERRIFWLDDAYEKGLLSQNDLKSVAYYYNLQYADEHIEYEDFTPREKNPAKLSETIREQIKNDYCKQRGLEKDLYDEVGVSSTYYGTYNDCMVFQLLTSCMVGGDPLFYPEYELDGVKFYNYSHLSVYINT